MHRTRLLVVSTAPDMLRSIEFALSAEGYTVTAVDDHGGARPEDYHLTIIDLPAARNEMVHLFCARAPKLVALADKPPGWLHDLDYVYVEKPILGPALVAAVRRELAREKPAEVQML